MPDLVMLSSVVPDFYAGFQSCGTGTVTDWLLDFSFGIRKTEADFTGKQSHCKCRITMVKWLTHLTVEVGVPGSSLSGVPFQFCLNILFDCFFFICCSQTAEDKRLAINPQLVCVCFLVDNQFIHRYSESPKIEVQKGKNELRNDAIT